MLNLPLNFKTLRSLRLCGKAKVFLNSYLPTSNLTSLPKNFGLNI